MWTVVTRWSSMVCQSVGWLVCRSVCLSVCHDLEPCKNSLTNRGAVCGMDFGGRKELCIRWGSRYPCVKLQFWGQNGAGSGHAWTCLTVDILKSAQQGSSTGTVLMPIGMHLMGCTLAPPVEYDWTVRMWRAGGNPALCQITLTTCY